MKWNLLWTHLTISQVLCVKYLWLGLFSFSDFYFTNTPTYYFRWSIFWPFPLLILHPFHHLIHPLTELWNISAPGNLLELKMHHHICKIIYVMHLLIFASIHIILVPILYLSIWLFINCATLNVIFLCPFPSMLYLNPMSRKESLNVGTNNECWVDCSWKNWYLETCWSTTKCETYWLHKVLQDKTSCYLFYWEN